VDGLEKYYNKHAVNTAGRVKNLEKGEGKIPPEQSKLLNKGTYPTCRVVWSSSPRKEEINPIFGGSPRLSASRHASAKPVEAAPRGGRLGLGEKTCVVGWK
jgi:hypothetical protein